MDGSFGGPLPPVVVAAADFPESESEKLADAALVAADEAAALVDGEEPPLSLVSAGRPCAETFEMQSIVTTKAREREEHCDAGDDRSCMSDVRTDLAPPGKCLFGSAVAIPWLYWRST